jgi:hypothetical protein
MKKVYSIIALALSTQLLFSGCSLSSLSKNKVAQQPTNQTQSDSSKSTSTTDQSNNTASGNTSNDTSGSANGDATSTPIPQQTDTTNSTTTPNNGANKQSSTYTNSSTTISKEDIQKYIAMTKESIIKTLGTNYKLQGSTLTFSNGLSFLGLSGNQSKPSIIKCSNTVKIAGIKNGMTFAQVESILGKTNVITTYVGTKTNTAYKIQYTIGKSLLKAISSSKDGKNSYIEICPV